MRQLRRLVQRSLYIAAHLLEQLHGRRAIARQQVSRELEIDRERDQGLLGAIVELALDAASRGGRERVFRALLAHPLIGQADVAETLADRMIEVNRDFLSWA